jgi:myo-inositol-1(or 4)-monophosphatase
MLRQVTGIVEEASAHLRGSFEKVTQRDVENKGVIDLVTRLDLEAQEIVQAGLARTFPGEPVLAEEDDTQTVPDGDCLWLVDPLDGTTNFVHGLPLFAVSVARVEAGTLHVGVVQAPCLGETYTAARGQGAFRNGERLQVSQRTRLLGESLLATGFPYDIRINPHNNLAEWSHLAVRCRGLRRCGAAALDLAWVAAGRFEAFWEYRLKPWDLAAGSLLVREAGGIVTDMQGGSEFLWNGSLVAGSPAIHPQLLGELQRLRRQDSADET